MKKFLHAVRKILCCLLFLSLTGGLLAYVNVVLTAKQTARQLTPLNRRLCTPARPSRT